MQTRHKVLNMKYTKFISKRHYYERTFESFNTLSPPLQPRNLDLTYLSIGKHVTLGYEHPRKANAVVAIDGHKALRNSRAPELRNPLGLRVTYIISLMVHVAVMTS